MTDFSTIAEGCANIIGRIEDYALSDTTTEYLTELESFHDALAHEVINLAGMLRTAVQLLATKEAA